MSSHLDSEDSNYKNDLIQISLPVISSAEFRREINSSRKILRRISSDPRVRGCQRYSNGNTSDQKVIIDSGRVVEARFTGLSICGRLSCPNCGRMRGRKAEREIEAIIKATHELGGKAQLIVATSRRAAQLDHEELIKMQSKANAKFLAKVNAAERTKLNIAGIAYMPEISYTDEGLNPHSNIVIIYSQPVTETHMRKVEEIYANVWIETHKTEGFPRPTRKHGITSQEIYNPSVISSYLTKSYKHGFPLSLLNKGWVKENGEIDETANGKVRNPHDILRLINSNPRTNKLFINLDKGESIIRLGLLEFAVVDKSGTLTELKKLPKIIRHWLDYETITKGKNVISLAKSKYEKPNELFWGQVEKLAAEKLEVPASEDRITITLSYNIQEWIESKSGVDELITELNRSVLGVESSENIEQAVKDALQKTMQKWGLTHFEDAVQVQISA